MKCTVCSRPLDERDLDILRETTMLKTQELLSSDSALKDKVVYIAGFLMHRFEIDDESDQFSTEFLDSLNRGGLSVPTLNVVFFVYSALEIHGQLPKVKRHCNGYVIKLLHYIDVPFSVTEKMCRTLVNTLCKAYVLKESERERQIGCLVSCAHM